MFRAMSAASACALYAATLIISACGGSSPNDATVIRDSLEPTAAPAPAPRLSNVAPVPARPHVDQAKPARLASRVQSINPAAVAFVSDESGNAVLLLTSGAHLAVRGDAGEVLHRVTPFGATVALLAVKIASKALKLAATCALARRSPTE